MLTGWLALAVQNVKAILPFDAIGSVINHKVIISNGGNVLQEKTVQST